MEKLFGEKRSISPGKFLHKYLIDQIVIDIQMINIFYLEWFFCFSFFVFVFVFSIWYLFDNWWWAIESIDQFDLIWLNIDWFFSSLSLYYYSFSLCFVCNQIDYLNNNNNNSREKVNFITIFLHPKKVMMNDPLCNFSLLMIIIKWKTKKKITEKNDFGENYQFASGYREREREMFMSEWNKINTFFVFSLVKIKVLVVMVAENNIRFQMMLSLL